MRAKEFVNPAQRRVDAMKQQARLLRKRAREAALRIKLQKTQQQLAQATRMSA